MNQFTNSPVPTVSNICNTPSGKMTDGDKLVKEIFADALEKANAADRAADLAEACGHDAQLRQQVEALLQAHEKVGGFLEEPAAALPGKTVVVSTPLTEKPGDHIGRYKLREKIGEGGCGVVYVAEQEEPVRRRVALKVIKLGMDTKSVIARFEAERQALAMMDHPNIAKIFDAGITESAVPEPKGRAFTPCAPPLNRPKSRRAGD